VWSTNACNSIDSIDDSTGQARSNWNWVAPQTLLSETFDTGTRGTKPAGWSVIEPTGSKVQIADVTSHSVPFSVELTDLGASRPSITHNFTISPSGSARARVLVPSGKGPAGIQLRTSTDTFLCAASIGKNGTVGYDNGDGTGTHYGTVAYTAGTWLDVRIDWFDDHTFDAYLGGTKFADRISFTNKADPGRLQLWAGNADTVPAQAYFDTVQVTPLQLTDGFEGYATGSPPTSPWTAAAPTGATIRVYDGSMIPSVAPENGGRAIQMTDTGTVRAELSRPFTPTPEGSVTYKARIQSAAEAPLDLHIRTASDTYLFAVRMQSDGKIAYNNNAGGSGAFTTTTTAWEIGKWQTIRIDWFADDTFDGYVATSQGTSQFASRRPFGTLGDPGKLKFVTDATSSDNVYLDNVAVSQQPVETVRGRYSENATWLTHSFVTTQRYVTGPFLPDMLSRMKDQYRVKYLYVNVGRVGGDGYLWSGNQLTYLIPLLNAIKTFETNNGYTFHVVAMVNGDTVLTGNPPIKVDLSIPGNRTHIAEECARFVSATTPLSHVTGATRVFDGCQLDIEPSANSASDTARFDNVKQLVQAVRNSPEMGGKSLGFTPPKLEFNPPNTDGWRWDPQNFYEMGLLVDQLQVMTYNSSTTSQTAYTDWIKKQTEGVLKAVSGETTGHAVPIHQPKIFIGFPAMGPYDSLHESGVETVAPAADGVNQALTELINQGSPSQRFFAGTAIFVQGDGTGYPCRGSDGGIVDAGSDGAVCETARYETDWWWYGRSWLGSW
jgi:hypothetical protein